MTSRVGAAEAMHCMLVTCNWCMCGGMTLCTQGCLLEHGWPAKAGWDAVTGLLLHSFESAERASHESVISSLLSFAVHWYVQQRTVD
eukprot:1760537-Amphidinium_carterae.1